MTLSELAAMLETVMPNKVVYCAWQEGNAPALPFICYLERRSNNFAADGIAYHRIKRIDVELYTDNKEPATEKSLEDAFDAAGIYWESSEDYIEDEKMYLKTYEIEV